MHAYIAVGLLFAFVRSCPEFGKTLQLQPKVTLNTTCTYAPAVLKIPSALRATAFIVRVCLCMRACVRAARPAALRMAAWPERATPCTGGMFACRNGAGSTRCMQPGARALLNARPIPLRPSGLCPAKEDVTFTCNPIACNASGTTVPLAGVCTSSLAGAAVGYKINGQQVLYVTCPAATTTVTVTPFISSYGGNACAYTGTPLSVTCERRMRQRCLVPRCMLAKVKGGSGSGAGGSGGGPQRPRRPAASKAAHNALLNSLTPPHHHISRPPATCTTIAQSQISCGSAPKCRFAGDIHKLRECPQAPAARKLPP